MAGSEYGNNYRGREPVQYSVEMVEHLDSREILEAYRDPDVQPAEDVGRHGGRRDIWNRSWEKLALEGRPGHLEHGPSSINEDRLYTGQYGESHTRAMNFALDLANTARGAAHFLRETVGRVRYAGASGPLTMRAYRGFYTHAVVAVCRRTKVRCSITIRQRQSLRNLIEAIPEAAWTPIPYWMDGAADVAETTCTPSRVSPMPRRCGSSSGG